MPSDTKKQKKLWKYILLSIPTLLLVIQLVPVQRSNPPLGPTLKAPAHIDRILRRSCYDCHSNETKWPWYSYIAPISWLVVYDVNEGRDELNFSMWGRYSKTKRKKFKQEIWKEIKEGEMPMKIYLLTHPNAGLSAKEKVSIKAWSLAPPTN